MSANAIEKYYGVDAETGNPSDDEDISGDENPIRSMPSAHCALTHCLLATPSTHQQDDQACKAVPVPLPCNPFASDKIETQLCDILQQVIIHDVTPENFGLTNSEWEDSGYPNYETIHVGHRTSRTFTFH